MEDTAVKFGILPHITFNTTVVETEWLEEEGRWRSLTSGGEEYCSQVRLVHLDVEDCSEELLRQQSHAIKNQLGHLDNQRVLCFVSTRL